MYIIVAGGGKVGYYLARSLIDEGHEILIIEKDRRKAERIAEELGSIVYRGDACEASVLADAGSARADMVLAVTGDDEDNLVICQVAKHKFRAPKTIARINNPKNEQIFKLLGIDVTVSSTNVILEHIQHEVPSHPLIHLLDLNKMGLEIVEVKVPAESPCVGRTLRQIPLPSGSIAVAVVDGEGNAQVPSGDTVIHAGDKVIFITKRETEPTLRKALAGR